MILQSLYALAQREMLVTDPAFEKQPVPLYVLLGESGKFNGIELRRGQKKIPSKKKGGVAKVVEDAGLEQLVPKEHGSPKVSGFARYFVDTIARILPVELDAKEQAKADASRATYWNQIAEVAAALPDDPAIQALNAFGQALDLVAEEINKQIEAKSIKWVKTDRLTFVYSPNGGQPINDEPALRTWYSNFYRSTKADQMGETRGICLVTHRFEPIPETHATYKGVPGGMPTGVSLISFDKDSFKHFGLEKARNASIGYPAALGVHAALSGLLNNTIFAKQGYESKRTVGDTAYLYWTRDDADLAFMSLFDDPGDEENQDKVIKGSMSRLNTGIDNISGGKPISVSAEANRFYLLCLSANSARVIVRGYLDTELVKVLHNVKLWFDQLRIAHIPSKDKPEILSNRFPLWQLASATAVDGKSAPVSVPVRLLRAALAGESIPDSILLACLRRLSAKGKSAFTAPRMALIKISLLRKDIDVSESLNDQEHGSAYVFGRLLAIFENIQRAALGKLNSNVVDKYYGTMSSAPRLVFARLCDSVQKHLGKLRGDKPGLAYKLEEYLGQVFDLLKDDGKFPPMQHTLQEQSLFALGYYHERADQAKRSAEKRIKKNDN